MNYRDQAIEWANKQIEAGIAGPIKINAWEVINDPVLYLQTNVQRIQFASHREQRLAYDRIRAFKQKIK
jgi:hypothetical protein